MICHISGPLGLPRRKPVAARLDAAAHHPFAPGQEGPDPACRVMLDVVHGSLGDDVPALGTGDRAHLHEPVGLGEDARVVVDHHHGVAVGDEVAHDAHEAVDVGGVQADAGLVEHVEHARRAVADASGQPHALALAGRERGARPVEREVAKAQLEQPARRVGKALADALGYGAHLVGQRLGHARHPGA